MTLMKPSWVLVVACLATPLTSQAQADGIGRIRITLEAQGQVAGQVVSRTLITEVTRRTRL